MMPQLGSLEKALRVGEGRRLKRLREQGDYIMSLEPVFEPFATVREAFKRVMGVPLFPVQAMGGIVLHEGDIAEMKTGEGKTFVASQALYLNALAGGGTHLVTVNDYLAKRDAERSEERSVGKECRSRWS